MHNQPSSAPYTYLAVTKPSSSLDLLLATPTPSARVSHGRPAANRVASCLVRRVLFACACVLHTDRLMPRVHHTGHRATQDPSTEAKPYIAQPGASTPKTGPSIVLQCTVCATLSPHKALSATAAETGDSAHSLPPCTAEYNGADSCCSRGVCDNATTSQTKPRPPQPIQRPPQGAVHHHDSCISAILHSAQCCL
jgi:hypothetical protein